VKVVTPGDLGLPFYNFGDMTLPVMVSISI